MQLEMFQQPVPVNIAKSVTKSSISQHCIQIVHLIRRRVTKKTAWSALFFQCLIQRERQRRPDFVLKHTCQTGRLFKLPVQLPSHSLKTKVARVGRLQKKQVQTGTKRNRFHQI